MAIRPMSAKADIALQKNSRMNFIRPIFS